VGARREQVKPYLSSELKEIAARAYVSYSRPAPATIGVCTGCCMAPKTARAMLDSAVGDISLDQILEWYGAAKDRDLSANHVFWMLPRVLDFIARGEDIAFCGNQIAFRHFRNASLMPQWPKSEKALFQEYAAAFMDARLDQRYPELDLNFCMFAKSGVEMGEVLARLDQCDPLRFSKAIIAEAYNGALRIGRDAFWEDSPALDAICNWLADPKLADRLMTWAMAHEGEDADLVWRAAGLVD